MCTLCVSGAVNTQGFVRIFLFFFYALYINFHSFIQDCDSLPARTLRMGDFKFHFENVEKNTTSRTLRSSSDTRMLKIQKYKRKKKTAFAPSLALDTTFVIHSDKAIDTAQL